MGAFCASFFVDWVRALPFSIFGGQHEQENPFFGPAGMIAALYVVLTHLQNFVWPESTSFAIQFRLSEALCVLAVMTPAAHSGPDHRLPGV